MPPAYGVVSNPRMGDEDKLRQAIEDFKKLINAKVPKVSESRAAIGRCLFRLGKLDEAKAALEEAINMRDSGPFWRAWINLRLGCIVDLKKRRSEAEAYYKKVLAIPTERNLEFQQGLARLMTIRPTVMAWATGPEYRMMPSEPRAAKTWAKGLPGTRYVGRYQSGEAARSTTAPRLMAA